MTVQRHVDDFDVAVGGEDLGDVSFRDIFGEFLNHNLRGRHQQSALSPNNFNALPMTRNTPSNSETLGSDSSCSCGPWLNSWFGSWRSLSGSCCALGSVCASGYETPASACGCAGSRSGHREEGTQNGYESDRGRGCAHGGSEYVPLCEGGGWLD